MTDGNDVLGQISCLNSHIKAISKSPYLKNWIGKDIVLIKCVWYRKHRMAMPLILNPFHTQSWRKSCKAVLMWSMQLFMKFCVLMSHGSENGHTMCWVGNILFFLLFIWPNFFTFDKLTRELIPNILYLLLFLWCLLLTL